MLVGCVLHKCVKTIYNKYFLKNIWYYEIKNKKHILHIYYL